ncbi:MAG: ABC transporter substrate-binding protein, partial [Candidatus Methylomirabilis sp.]
MRLRIFGLSVTLALAVGLLSAPLAADAQQPAKVYRLGVLNPTFAGFFGSPLLWLREIGYVEGKNIVFENRFAGGRDERLAELAAELVRLKVDAILTSGTPAVRAAQQATKTIPIVMVVEGDPVRAGLVSSLARPGGNITGMTTLGAELSGKRLQLLKEAVPGLTRVAVLWNQADPEKAEEWKDTKAAAQKLGLRLQSLEVGSREELEAAFQAAMKERAGALLVLADRLTGAQSKTIAELAAKNRLPAMYPSRWFVDIQKMGGLMSYSPASIDVNRRVAAYIDKILKGAKPADL